MIEGSSAMFDVWLSFFREHCAGFVALFVLLPMTLSVNWRLGAILIVLVIIFAVAMNTVVRRTDTRQELAGELRTELAERVSDVLGNLPVIQSFGRIEDEFAWAPRPRRPAAGCATAGLDVVGDSQRRDAREFELSRCWRYLSSASGSISAA